jgi:hypothetical protein
MNAFTTVGTNQLLSRIVVNVYGSLLPCSNSNLSCQPPAVNRFERSIDSLVLDFARTARIAIDFYSAGMAIKQGMARLAMFE